MQYILSQEEYDQLTNTEFKLKESYKKALQKVCTMAACNTLIKVKWSKEPVIWGCADLPENHEDHVDHCDDCPALAVCPSEHISFSK